MTRGNAQQTMCTLRDRRSVAHNTPKHEPMIIGIHRALGDRRRQSVESSLHPRNASRTSHRSHRQPRSSPSPPLARALVNESRSRPAPRRPQDIRQTVLSRSNKFGICSTQIGLARAQIWCKSAQMWSSIVQLWYKDVSKSTAGQVCASVGSRWACPRWDPGTWWLTTFDQILG